MAANNNGQSAQSLTYNTDTNLSSNFTTSLSGIGSSFFSSSGYTCSRKGTYMVNVGVTFILNSSKQPLVLCKIMPFSPCGRICLDRIETYVQRHRIPHHFFSLHQSGNRYVDQFLLCTASPQQNPHTKLWRYRKCTICSRY